MLVNEENAKVAVILVNYNGIDDTLECLKSLDRCSSNVFVVVVDNASLNDQYLLIKSEFSSVKVLHLNENVGFAGGNNIGIEAIKSDSIEYFLLLNNDTVIESNMIQILLKYANTKCICAPKMNYYDRPNYTWYGGGTFNRFTGRAVHININSLDKHEKTPIECSFSTGCCMLINREIFKTIGLLDDSYFMYCEDTEFCIRARKNGIKIMYVPLAKLYHKVSASTGGGDSAFCLYYMTRNRLRYLNDYKESFGFIAKIVTVFTRLIRMAQYALHKDKRWRAILKGITDYKKGLTGKVENIV